MKTKDLYILTRMSSVIIGDGVTSIGGFALL